VPFPGSHRRDFKSVCETSCLQQALQGAIVSGWCKAEDGALFSDLLHPDSGKIPVSDWGCDLSYSFDGGVVLGGEKESKLAFPKPLLSYMHEQF